MVRTERGAVNPPVTLNLTPRGKCALGGRRAWLTRTWRNVSLGKALQRSVRALRAKRLAVPFEVPLESGGGALRQVLHLLTSGPVCPINNGQGAAVVQGASTRLC